jgi:hypothetical protein
LRGLRWARAAAVEGKDDNEDSGEADDGELSRITMWSAEAINCWKERKGDTKQTHKREWNSFKNESGQNESEKQ